jgi:hypothetical protein
VRAVTFVSFFDNVTRTQRLPFYGTGTVPFEMLLSCSYRISGFLCDSFFAAFRPVVDFVLSKSVIGNLAPVLLKI